MKQFIALAALATLAGCAHGTMRGSVAMKASENEGHVCMGEGEVKAGNRVALYKNDCQAPKGRANFDGYAGCTKTKLGEGVIERVLNSHYSVMQADPGVSFEEGTIVEKIGS